MFSESLSYQRVQLSVWSPFGSGYLSSQIKFFLSVDATGEPFPYLVEGIFLPTYVLSLGFVLSKLTVSDSFFRYELDAPESLRLRFPPLHR
ncbi:hypothetical protein Tco_0256644 [Tanacetum coccineum]